MEQQRIYPRAFKYLERVREAERHVQKLEDRKANLMMLLTDTAAHLKDVPQSRDQARDKVPAVMAEIDSLEREIREAKKKLEDIREETGMMICRISSPISQKVLILHHLKNMTWREIAKKIRYGRSHTYRFRDRGYEELEKNLEQDSLNTGTVPSWDTDGTQKNSNGTKMGL